MYGSMVNCDNMTKKIFSMNLGLAVHKYSWDFEEERTGAVHCIQITKLMAIRGRIWKYMKKMFSVLKLLLIEKLLL